MILGFKKRLLHKINKRLYLRYVTNESGQWERKYKRQTRIEIEKFWKKKLSEKWDKREVFQDDSVKPKFYCLSMFPYPSGRLHMGHVRVYTISDTFAHFYRMNGYNVIHPMGWDAFGLPAENAARDRNLDPKEWTMSNIEYMKNQLKDLNLMFDWEREISTCDPKYFKWTQYIFLKLFQAGLAYQKDALVNWDPVDKTVLADEQVDAEGRSWRSGAIVEQKFMKQWFLRATEFSESLLNSLNEIEEDYGVKAMQKHWIGELDGCYLDCILAIKGEEICPISIFCAHPEAVMESSHIVIQSKYKAEVAHLLSKYDKKEYAQKISMLTNEDECMLDDCMVRNPFTEDMLPLVISSRYDTKYEKTTAILAIPRVDDIAGSMAKLHNISCQSHQSVHAHSRSNILLKAKEMGISNGKMYSSKLRDWLISRQRYWGTPIPIIHCPEHGAVPVPITALPVELPKIKEVKIKPGQSPLETVSGWVNTTCPKCGAPAKRETDTMDTFVDSSWYFLRYADPHNTVAPFFKEKANELIPVDLYIGGKEHAVLHLYFARFINHFLVSKEALSHSEPFRKLLVQGLIKGVTHQVKSSGKYVPIKIVNRTGKVPVTKDTGEVVEETFQKMSKSKLNGIDPEEFVDEWGISIMRLYVLYAAAPFEDIHWDVKTDVIPGVMRMQLKLWTCVTKIIDARKFVSEELVKKRVNDLSYHNNVNKLNYDINKAINDITMHYRKDCVLSAAITCIMILAKILNNIPKEVIQHSKEFERGLCAVVIMSAPMVPHYASELWSGLQLMEYKLTEHKWDKDVLEQSWPKPEPSPSQFREFAIKINGVSCDTSMLPAVVADWHGTKQIIMGNTKVNKLLHNEEVIKLKVNENTHEILISTNKTS